MLRGGPSSEYEVSLKSGASVLEALDREKYDPRDIFITRDGIWHVHGMPVTPEKALKGVDVAFNVIHGEYGEDGRLHRILDRIGTPYTGSDLFTSVRAYNKHHTKEALQKFGVKLAHGVLVDKGDTEALAHQLFRSFPHPAVIKPVIGGSSVGMSVAHHFHGLQAGLDRAFELSPKVLVEEFIPGREATVGVVDDFRGHKSYALMPVEIVPPADAAFFDYEAKYSGKSIERVPGNFTEAEKAELMRVARLAHEELGLTHYSRSDFIVSKRGIYFLEINNAAAVGLTSESLLPKALHAVGVKLSEFVDHVVGLARRGVRKLG